MPIGITINISIKSQMTLDQWIVLSILWILASISTDWEIFNWVTARHWFNNEVVSYLGETISHSLELVGLLNQHISLSQLVRQYFGAVLIIIIQSPFSKSNNSSPNINKFNLFIAYVLTLFREVFPSLAQKLWIYGEEVLVGITKNRLFLCPEFRF